MSRRNDAIIAVIEGYKVMSKKPNSFFTQNPQGAYFSLTDEFMEAFLKMYDEDEVFRRNFTTKEINYLPVEKSLGRPDRTSIGFIEGYEIFKVADLDKVFMRNPMGAFMSYPHRSSQSFIQLAQ